DADAAHARVLAARVRFRLTRSGIRRLTLERKLRSDLRPLAGGAANADRAAQSFDAVGEAEQTRAARWIGSAAAVVADRHQQVPVARCERDLHVRGLRMLGR